MNSKSPYLLEVNEDDGVLHEVSYAFYLGAKRYHWLNNVTLNYKTETYKNLQKYEQPYVPVGSVRFVRRYMELHNVKYEPLYYSHPLFEGNRPTPGLLGDVQSKGEYPVFVKPTEIKRFSGLILDDEEEYDELLQMYKLSSDEKVFYNYNVRDYTNEVRLYVYKNRVVGATTYYGDPKFHVDYDSHGLQGLHDYYDVVAYALDIGYDRLSNTWHPVEVNDFWGVGPYGCPPEYFYRCTFERWVQITSGD